MSYDKKRVKKQESIGRLFYVMKDSISLFTLFSNLMEVKSINDVQ
jgi:hypothetical protein